MLKRENINVFPGYLRIQFSIEMLVVIFENCIGHNTFISKRMRVVRDRMKGKTNMRADKRSPIPFCTLNIFFCPS